MAKYFLLFFCLFCKIANGADSSWQNFDNISQVKISASYDQNFQNILILTHFKIKKNWNIYAVGGDDGQLAPNFDFRNSTNINHQISQEIFWPQSIAKKEKIFDKVINYNIYQDEVIIPIKLAVINNQEITNLDLNLNYALCNEICIPVTKNFNLQIAPLYQDRQVIDEFVNNEFNQSNKLSQKSPENNKLTLYILFAAFLGGLILNIMPCVLPVLSIKLMSIIKHGGGDLKNIQKDARSAILATFIGIIFSFLILAAMVIVLKFFGATIGWGIQFQNPYFLSFLIIVTLIFAANLWGIFEININPKLENSLNNKIEQSFNKKKIFLPNFLLGILAVLLATPCSAPFLGTAISFAFLADNIQIILIFLLIAFGMAFPYVILFFSPGIIKLLPKSGQWMIIFKKIMAIFLLITAIWLICILFFRISSVGLDNRFDNGLDNNRNNGFNKNLAKINWQKFDQQKIEDLIAAEKTILIDITASWCLTCKFNKINVLDDKEIVAKLKKDNIITMRGDITKPNEEIMDFLASHQRFAIPFNIIYCQQYPNGILLSEILSKKELLQKLQKCKN